MLTIKASEFKAKCLSIMDRVAATGEVITITKNGKPVAQLAPAIKRPKTLFGALKGMTPLKEDSDVMSPVDVKWKASGK